MSTQAKATGLVAILLLCGASVPPAAVAGGINSLLQPALQQGRDSGLLIQAAAARGGGRAAGAGQAAANRGGGGAHQVRSSANSNVNHNRATNVAGNRNVNANRNFSANVNRNVNIDRDVNVNVDRDYNGGWDDHWHPLAAAAAITATAAVVGSIVNSVPPSCSTVVVNGVSYSQCGSTWYQPQYAGTSVQYVVVNPPQ
jgi:hypothetical protein